MSTILEARTVLIATAMVALLGLSACGDTWGQRAVTGGALGAGGGALAGRAMGIDPITGAVIGGLGGAALGAATAPPQRRYRNYY